MVRNVPPLTRSLAWAAAAGEEERPRARSPRAMRGEAKRIRSAGFMMFGRYRLRWKGRESLPAGLLHRRGGWGCARHGYRARGRCAHRADPGDPLIELPLHHREVVPHQL